MILHASWLEGDGVSVSIFISSFFTTTSVSVGPGDDDWAGRPKSAESKLAQPLSVLESAKPLFPPSLSLVGVPQAKNWYYIIWTGIEVLTVKCSYRRCYFLRFLFSPWWLVRCTGSVHFFVVRSVISYSVYFWWQGWYFFGCLFLLGIRLLRYVLITVNVPPYQYR